MSKLSTTDDTELSNTGDTGVESHRNIQVSSSVSPVVASYFSVKK
jgi:hypothetical protein